MRQANDFRSEPDGPIAGRLMIGAGSSSLLGVVVFQVRDLCAGFLGDCTPLHLLVAGGSCRLPGGERCTRGPLVQWLDCPPASAGVVATFLVREQYLRALFPGG